MPKISTGQGDKGFTRICCDVCVRKDDPRVEAFGAIDELNSFLGHISSKHELLKPEIKEIQKELYLICSNLEKYDETLIKKDNIKRIEHLGNEIEKELPELKHFLIPGGIEAAAMLHFARSICRRCERNVVHLTDKYKINEDILVYLNRLSDLLFLMARKENFYNGIGDEELGVENE